MVISSVFDDMVLPSWYVKYFFVVIKFPKYISFISLLSMFSPKALEVISANKNLIFEAGFIVFLFSNYNKNCYYNIQYKEKYGNMH